MNFQLNRESENEKTTPFKSNPKLDALVADLDECSDFPVIVIAFHVAEIHAIYNKLKEVYSEDRVEYICGEVSTDSRATIIEGFKHGDVKILVANARTIGSGYNLQISHVQYFFSNSYSMEEREQVEDRIHRDGQRSSSVLYKDIVAKNTIDEKAVPQTAFSRAKPAPHKVRSSKNQIRKVAAASQISSHPPVPVCKKPVSA